MVDMAFFRGGLGRWLPPSVPPVDEAVLLSHGKRIGGRLRVGEVSKRCAHDGDRQKGDAETKRGDFLFHVLLLLLCIMFSMYVRRKMLENQSKG